VSQIGPSAKFQGFEIFEKTGASTWTVIGNGNQNWTIAQGTLRGDTDSLQGNVVNNAALVFAQDFNGAYGGTISGTGTLTKEGAGALTMTGVNPFTGGTSLLAGGLFVNGGLSNSTVSVLGGTLGGTGVIGSLGALAGGTVAPGNGGFGTLTVTGNASLRPARSSKSGRMRPGSPRDWPWAARPFSPAARFKCSRCPAISGRRPPSPFSPRRAV